MKKLNNILFSMTTTVILLLIFGASIGYATFIENAQSTEVAREVIYNALWFELLLTFLIINMLGSVVRYEIFNKRKFSVLLFHLSFVLIIIGAAVTRYFGSEGYMHIREGETSNEMSSDVNSLRIIAQQGAEQVEKTKQITFTAENSDNFSELIRIGDNAIRVSNSGFVPNAVETIVATDKGQPALALFVMSGGENGGQDLILTEGEAKPIGASVFSFADSTQDAAILFFRQNDVLFFKSSLEMSEMGMIDQTEHTLQASAIHEAKQRTIYKSGSFVFVLKAFYPAAKKEISQLTPEMNKMGVMREGKNALKFFVTDGNKTEQINILAGADGASMPATCDVNGVKVTLAYGKLAQKLPFSIQLRDFELQRYPGSNSPSSYASEITVKDSEMHTEMPFRIYMNNILKYRGYRFFQSSYDQDEGGTILSVNHDYWGTTLTYIGYFFMMIGMVLTLFNKNSRFRTVVKLSKDLEQKRRNSKLLSLALLFAFGGSLMASNPAKEHHLQLLNSMLIQDQAQGRIEPFSTYASDVFRKISKKSSYNGLSNTEVVLGMFTDPAKWENERFIKVGNELLADELGAINGYVSFNQMFDQQKGGAYKLTDKVNQAYQKEQSQRNKYETELIYVDERVNICYQLFESKMLNIFPDANDTNSSWIVPQAVAVNPMPSMAAMDAMDGTQGDVSAGKCPAGGDMGTGEINQSVELTGVCPAGGKKGMTQEQIDALIAQNSGSFILPEKNSPDALFANYKNAVLEAYTIGNWENPTSLMASIKEYQLSNGGANLPSESKVKLEMLYNDLNVFGYLGIVYFLIGFVLLSLHINDIFRPTMRMQKILDTAIYPFAVTFAVYTLTLAARWYISGHAPWSNGYEAMIFVGWATSLAGLIFARHSALTLAVTGILSAIALFTASMSWMNPEITNLVPVLKSYWLIVHVAIITSSYGFLAMGAILGMLNLVLMILRGKHKGARLKSNIQEISYIIELSLSVGLFMLTIGCFLGGVWANESWGRYWGWDPKETWALVCILVYSAILHLRSIPRFNNQLVLNSLALVGFGSVIMAFLGVNYYLSGMHSYGAGTSPGIPSAAYLILGICFSLIYFAYQAERKK